MRSDQNPTKTLLSNAIKDYTAGRSNQGEFRLALAGRVPIDGKIERLLRQHEAVDNQSYASFGKLIFRHIDPDCSSYNRVDKIGMNDPSSVSPDKAFRQFSTPQEIPKRKKKVTDKKQIDEEWRNQYG